MKKKAVFVAVLLAFLVITPRVFAQYNRELVVSVMRDNVRLMGDINSAARTEDFYTAAVRLMELAEGFKSLEAVSPPKGSKAEWDRIHNELIEAAFRGIGACGERDGNKLQAEIAVILALNQEGHAKFR